MRMRGCGMVFDERGSESVQFSFAAVLLIIVAFGIMQAVMMNAAAIMLSSELTQACMRIDVSGLRAASDRESFVAGQILDEFSQLRRSDLSVSGVKVESTAREDALPAGGLSSRTASTLVSYDVSYKAPISLAGFREGGRLSRHVTCAVVDERVTEVSLA